MLKRIVRWGRIGRRMWRAYSAVKPVVKVIIWFASWVVVTGWYPKILPWLNADKWRWATLALALLTLLLMWVADTLEGDTEDRDAVTVSYWEATSQLTSQVHVSHNEIMQNIWFLRVVLVFTNGGEKETRARFPFVLSVQRRAGQGWEDLAPIDLRYTGRTAQKADVIKFSGGSWRPGHLVDLPGRDDVEIFLNLEAFFVDPRSVLGKDLRVRAVFQVIAQRDIELDIELLTILEFDKPYPNKGGHGARPAMKPRPPSSSLPNVA